FPPRPGRAACRWRWLFRARVQVRPAARRVPGRPGGWAGHPGPPGALLAAAPGPGRPAVVVAHQPERGARSRAWSPRADYTAGVTARFGSTRPARLLMRRWRDADRRPFAAMNADPEVMRYFPAALDRTASDEYIDRIEVLFERQGFGLWALEEA